MEPPLDCRTWVRPMVQAKWPPGVPLTLPMFRLIQGREELCCEVLESLELPPPDDVRVDRARFIYLMMFQAVGREQRARLAQDRGRLDRGLALFAAGAPPAALAGALHPPGVPGVPGIPSGSQAWSADSKEAARVLGEVLPAKRARSLSPAGAPSLSSVLARGSAGLGVDLTGFDESGS